jgi:SPP1 gp7 family putative phage head morphogenesis protein
MGLKTTLKNTLKGFATKNFSEQELNVMMAAKSDAPLSEQVDNRMTPISRQEVDDWLRAVNGLRSIEPTRVLMSRIYDRMMLDDTVTRGIQKRMSRVKRSRFKLMGADGEHNQEATKLMEAKWFTSFLGMSMTSIFRGPQLIEITELKDREISKLTLMPEGNVNYWKKFVTKYTGDLNGWDYTDPTLAPYYLQAGDTDDFGLLMKVSVPFIYMSFIQAIAVDYVHKFGTPPRVLMHRGADTTRLRQLNELMKNMLSSNYAIIKEGEELKIFEPSNTAGSKDLFESLIKMFQSNITGLLVGENGTTEKDGTGTYGSLKVMAEVSDAIHDMDKMMLHYLINEDLMPRLVQMGYPFKGLSFAWDDFQDLSAKDLIQAVKDLSQYYEFEPEEVARRTGLPITKLRRLPGEFTEEANGGGLGKFKARMRALYGEPSHAGVSIAAIGGGDAERVIREIFDGKVDANQLDAALATSIGDDLYGGASGAFDFGGIDYNAPDNLLASRMRDNLYAFSSAKTYAQMKEMSELLVDDQGRVRSFADFKLEAEKVAKIHNVTWLETERNNAVASGQMGAQWNRYEADADLFPFLEYVTAGDARVRNEHSLLDGVVKPIGDAWWDKNYPPLGHGCRCDATSTSDSSRLTTSNPSIDVPPAFQANVGKTGIVYTNAHPYYQVLPQAPTALDAIRNYGMRPASKVLADPKGLKTAPSKAFEESAEYRTATDHNGLAVRLDDEPFRESDKAHLASEVLALPSEVWTSVQSTRYLKYYENGAALVDVNGAMTVSGWRWFDLAETELMDTVRNGILLKR